ncbi:MAG: phenylalanine--tRNA ligase subunit beta, partial [Oscillospiraceae bacterium]|nr:phenylalanine--tRNA ligase subunit beta [Oscillospiraceae bacterium]
NMLPALTRALQLVEELDAGDIVNGIVDIRGNTPERKHLPLQPDVINKFLGINLTTDEMVRILESLEFEVSDDLIVTPPTFRGDILLMNDIAEEIARIYGYDNIPNTVMKGIATAKPTDRQTFEHALALRLVAAGLYETKTYSFMGTKTLDLIGEPKDSKLRKVVKISNPFGDDTAYMRTTMLPSMLEVVARNANARVPSASLYEIGVVFRANDDENILPEEPKELIIASYNDLDFFGVKGILEDICEHFNTVSPRFAPLTTGNVYHPGKAATVYVGNIEIGTLGELLPTIASNFNIKEKVTVAQISVEALYAVKGDTKRFTPLPKFPALTRDLAIVVDKATPSEEVENHIKTACGDILESISVFDVYTGDKIEQGKKSIAYSLKLRHSDRTLKDEEADSAIKAALDSLKTIGAVLRS